jgi:hypothetical protein
VTVRWADYEGSALGPQTSATSATVPKLSTARLGSSTLDGSNARIIPSRHACCATIQGWTRTWRMPPGQFLAFSIATRLRAIVSAFAIADRSIILSLMRGTLELEMPVNRQIWGGDYKTQCQPELPAHVAHERARAFYFSASRITSINALIVAFCH